MNFKESKNYKGNLALYLKAKQVLDQKWKITITPILMITVTIIPAGRNKFCSFQSSI